MVRHLSSEALLVRRVEYGEADLVLTFFTRELGKVSALGRGARKSRRRFSGSLEPFHTLRLELDERPHSDLYLLRAAQLVTPRRELLRDLDAMLAAGQALGWVEHASPPRTPEPRLWAVLETLFDELDALDGARPAELPLAEAGLALLGALGWGLDFERCVRCGKSCGATQAASIDAPRGGLVCRNCGGARLRLKSQQRKRLRHAAQGARNVLQPDDTVLALGLTEQVMQTHAGI